MDAVNIEQQRFHHTRWHRPIRRTSEHIGPPIFAPGGGCTLDAYPAFFMPIAPGTISFKYTWLATAPSAQPSAGYFKVGLNDLVLLANAYGTTGTPPSTVSISSVPGASHTWNPAADIGAPAGVVGLSDLVTLALHYGWYWGAYGYNPPYPPAEAASNFPRPSWEVDASPSNQTYVYLTAQDSLGNTLNVAVYQNGTLIGTTPQNVTISANTIFRLDQFVGFEAFQTVNFTHSGIGIHAVYG